MKPKNKRNKSNKSCLLLLTAALTLGSALPAFAADSGGSSTPAPAASVLSSGAHRPWERWTSAAAVISR
ncbi:hypothetical protein LJK87_17155 [Paenibacillus sp. P25]|nr:hypothetical protein LJK87_17155 [Paenibacillus sp. P25]